MNGKKARFIRKELGIKKPTPLYMAVGLNSFFKKRYVLVNPEMNFYRCIKRGNPPHGSAPYPIEDNSQLSASQLVE